MQSLPNWLSAFRIAMVPVLLLLAWYELANAFLIALTASLASDVLDGMVARAFDARTALGAKLDSWGDLLTWAVGIPCVVWLWPDRIRAEAPFFAIAIVSFVVPTLYGAIRFRALTSYHTLGAKASALLIGPGALLLFAFDVPWLFRLATFVLALSALEELAITHRLDAPRANVRSYWHLRAALRREADAPPQVETARGDDG